MDGGGAKEEGILAIKDNILRTVEKCHTGKVVVAARRCKLGEKEETRKEKRTGGAAGSIRILLDT